MSVALAISYLTIVLVLVTVIVLCCLGCKCHIPLGKCVRCFIDSTKRCCNKKVKKLNETKSGAKKAEPKAPVLAGRRRSANDDDPPCTGCLRGIPWLLTCGYCFGTMNDGDRTRQKSKSPSTAVAVAQPIDPSEEVVGTECIMLCPCPYWQCVDECEGITRGS